MQQQTRKSILLAGAFAWLVDLATSLNIYVLSLDGDWSQWNWSLVGTAFLTAFIAGGKDLHGWMMGKGDSTAPIKPDVEPKLTTVDIVPTPRNTLNLALMKQELIKDEGYRDHLYRDTEGHMTAGIGHLITHNDPESKLPLGAKVSDSRVQQWFNDDLDNAFDDALRLYPDLPRYPIELRHVLVNMAFNLGYDRFRGFTETRRLIQAGKLTEASVEMLDSKWAKQVGVRADKLSVIVASLGDTPLNIG